jgi:chaperonin GroEL (HSP60 family)
MNKILQSSSTGDINVTNDGATILKAIQLDNAAAKILVNISKVQDDEVGDGTTSVTVLAAELLREAERLIGQKIHPQTIVEGYRIASLAALKALEKAAVDHACVARHSSSFIVADALAMNAGLTLLVSEKTCSILLGRRSHQKSFRRTRIILLILQLTPSSD